MNLPNIAREDKATNSPIVMDLTQTNAVAEFFENLINWVSEGHGVIYIEMDTHFETVKDRLKPFPVSTKLIEYSGSHGRQACFCRQYSLGESQLIYLERSAVTDAQDLDELVKRLTRDDAMQVKTIIVDSLFALLNGLGHESPSPIPDISALSALVEGTDTTWILLDRKPITY